MSFFGSFGRLPVKDHRSFLRRWLAQYMAFNANGKSLDQLNDVAR